MNARISLIAFALTTALAGTAQAGDIAIRGGIVHTMHGEAIRDGVVVIRGGKIAAVGPAASTPIPAGMQTLDAAVVTPGLVDAHGTAGLAGYMNQPHDQDQLDGGAPLQPQLRAIDAYNPNERLIQWLRELGVTTLHTGHGTGAVISGQTMIVKTRGSTVDQAVLRPQAMIAGELGPGALAERGKSPGTRAKQMAMLRALLIKARGGSAATPGDHGTSDAGKSAETPRKAWEWEAGPEVAVRAESSAKPTAPKPAAKAGDGKDKDSGGKPRELDIEAMRDVLARRVPLLVTAHTAQDIVTALRLKREFNIDLVLDGAAEAYMVLDEIKAANVPVILHPPMARQNGELENASWTTPAKLRAAGIPFALQSGYEGYVPKTRVVLWEAAIAAANGLTPEQALASITSDAARILRISQRVGSLEVGKDGDVALFDGDPFEYSTHVTGVVIYGDVVSRVLR